MCYNSNISPRTLLITNTYCVISVHNWTSRNFLSIPFENYTTASKLVWCSVGGWILSRARCTQSPSRSCFQPQSAHSVDHNTRSTKKTRFDSKMHDSTQKSPVRHKNARFDTKMPSPACISWYCHYQTSRPLVWEIFFPSFNPIFRF